MCECTCSILDLSGLPCCVREHSLNAYGVCICVHIYNIPCLHGHFGY